MSARLPDERRERDFRRLWAAQGVSTFGSLVTRAALPFTAALALGANAAQMALLGAANLVAGVLVAPLVGPWLDRSRRKPVMLACDAVRALLLAAIPVAALSGHLTFELLLVVQVLSGAFSTVFDVAQASWLPELVGEAGLVRANARLAGTNAVAEMASFGLAGWLVQWFGGPIAIALDALSYVGSALALTGIRTPERVAVTVTRDGVARSPLAILRTALGEAADGLRLAFADPALAALAIAEAALFAAFGTFMACYTLFATRELALPTGPLGMVFGLGGAAALAAAWAAPRLGRALGVRGTMALGLALGAVGLTLATIAPPGRPAVALALLAAQQLVGDGGWTLFLVHAGSLRMQLAPAQARARVAAGAHATGVTAMLAGSALAAAIAGRW
ncbi:MAG: MFS transporter, partial [Candidatus Eisenbacteria bacterium]